MSRCVILAMVAITLFAADAPAQGKKFLGKTKAEWLKGLEDPNPKTRQGAAFAIGKMGIEAFGDLQQLLTLFESDRDAGVKDATAFAIGEIRKAGASYPLPNSQQYVNAFHKALSSSESNAMVKRSAAYALGCLGNDAAGSFDAIKALETAIKDSDPAVRQNAAWALGSLGTGGVLSLANALGDRDPYVVRDAAASLARAKVAWGSNKDRVPVMLALKGQLTNPDTEVKKAVVQALVKVVEPADAAQVSAPLQQLVNNAKEHAEVKLNAAIALANVGGAQAGASLDSLLNALKSSDVALRRQAAALIGNLGKKALTAIPELKKALADPDAAIRGNAATSLGTIGISMNPVYKADKSAPDDPDRPQITQVVPDLINLLDDAKQPPDVRAAAAVAIEKIGPCTEGATPRAMGVLVKIVADKSISAQVRAKALWPIRFYQTSASNAELHKALADIISIEGPTLENKDLRYDAAYLLGKYQKGMVSDKVLDTLLEFLKDESVFVAKDTKGSGGGTGMETGTGGAGTTIGKGGDGRVMAVAALRFIVNEKDGGNAAKVSNRKDILQQLKVLANTTKDELVKKYTVELNEYLGN